MAIVPTYFGGVNFDVRHIIVNSQIWFCGKDVGETLEYTNPTKACRVNVKDKYQKRLSQITNPNELDQWERNSIYISEPGLWQWLGSSKQAKAEPFQNWLWEKLLPALRKNMVLQAQHAGLRNETDLHYRVVAFIKSYYPDALLTAGLGELQNTSQKRIDSYKKGYRKGSPDLIIHNHHARWSGMAIEMKHPLGSGILSESQEQVLEQYARNNFKTLVSNSYDDLIFSIVQYMSQVRICCLYCTQKFKSETSLQEHLKGFHRNLKISGVPARTPRSCADTSPCP
jgi:prophage antirepressor-like protein